MPQLDGLRAIAFLAVAVSHWIPVADHPLLPFGTGVQLFFVLSGFLITGILLRSRPDDLGVSLCHVLRIFYARRVLRIFPLYYGVLALAAIFAISPIATTWPWHVGYLSNFHFAFRGHTNALTDPFLHLWSLSVEEQFYLVWPFVVLLLRPRALLVTLWISVVGSMVFRVGIAHAAPGLATVRYLTPSCLDALAVGGLIAHAKHYAGELGVRRLTRVLGSAGFIGLAVSLLFLPQMVGPDDARRIGHTFLVVFYGGIVAQAAEGFGGFSGRVLSAGPLRYLGKISYGLYVYHYFAAVVISRLATNLGWETLLRNEWTTIFAYSAFTFTAAVLSWHLYEGPINRLKRHFTLRASSD